MIVVFFIYPDRHTDRLSSLPLPYQKTGSLNKEHPGSPTIPYCTPGRLFSTSAACMYVGLFLCKYIRRTSSMYILFLLKTKKLIN